MAYNKGPQNFLTTCYMPMFCQLEAQGVKGPDALSMEVYANTAYLKEICW